MGNRIADPKRLRPASADGANRLIVLTWAQTSGAVAGGLVAELQHAGFAELIELARPLVGRLSAL
jgi:hypothetical protein